jgi:hypothetical protein
MTAQLTITERFIERERQRANYTNYTVTENRSTSPVVLCSWLPDVWKQLQAMASLPDGWDSYGAPSPDTNKLEAAWGLLVCLCDNADLPKPYVNPTRNGGVQFEWEAGERYFELEVVAERAATYLYCDNAAHVEETGNVFEEESLEPVLAYIRSVGALQ